MNLSGSAEVTLHPDVTNTTSGPAFPAVLLSFGDTVVYGGAVYDDENWEFGGVTLQAFDISIGTPVRTDRKTREMNSIEGAYPAFDDLMAVKLDESRGLITWGKGVFTPVWAMVFQVDAGVITFGMPVSICLGQITPANPAQVQNVDGVLRVNSGWQSALTARPDGRGTYFSVFSDYYVPGNFSLYQDRVAAVDIVTSALEVTGSTWWVLEPGYQGGTYSYSNVAAARTVGNRTFYLSSLRAKPSNDDYAFLGVVDWDAATPQMTMKLIENVAGGPSDLVYGGGMEVAGAHLVFRKGADWVLQETADLATPVIRVPVEGDASPTGGASFRALDQSSSTDEWLGTWWDETSGVRSVAKYHYVDGIIARTDSSPFSEVPPQDNSVFDWVTAVFAGQSVLVLTDFEVLAPPFPFREFLYVYGKGLQEVHLLPARVMFAPPG